MKFFDAKQATFSSVERALDLAFAKVFHGNPRAIQYIHADEGERIEIMSKATDMRSGFGPGRPKRFSDQTLRRLVSEGMCCADIARRLDVTPPAVRSRADKIGLKMKLGTGGRKPA